MLFANYALSDTQTSLNDRVSDSGSIKITKRRKQLIWTVGENEIYVSFLKNNRENFRNEKIRRKQKVFIKLALFVKNRTAEQCRSHHQRMMVSHKSIAKIIKHLQFLSINQRNNLGTGIIEGIQIKQMIKPPQDVEQMIKQIIESKKTENKQSKCDSKEGELWNIVNLDFWFGN